MVHWNGMELREWREANGWRRIDLAEMLDISPKTLGRYEIGERLPPPDLMVDLFILSGGRLRPDHLAVPVIRKLYEEGRL